MKKIKNSYRKSGVNISLANKLVNHLSDLSKKDDQKRNNAFNKENIGGFGSLYDISNLRIKDPVIVSCTDGVGTKLDLANKFKKFDTIGIDLVAMCVNDLIVQGAKPLFFLDYIAFGKLNLSKSKKILRGIIKGCKISRCSLIGGETAEMPGIYSRNNFDLAGFSVGIVSKKKILSKKNVKPGDIILAVPSTGIHSNGFSLVRSIIKNKKISNKLKKELLKPTKIYVKKVLELINKKYLKACANITGGGLEDNIKRVIPQNFCAEIYLEKIKTLKIFKWLKKEGISDKEMLKTFNCGVGFCLIVNPKNFEKVIKFFPNNGKPYIIGKITKNSKKVKLSGKISW